MDNPQAQFDAEDLALIELAIAEHDAENPDPTVDETGTPLPGAQAPAAPAPAPLAAPAPAPALPAPAPPAQAPAAPAQAPAAEAPVAAPAAPAPAPADHHLNAALRVARQQAERLRLENEALKAAQATPAPPAAPAVKRPDAEALKDLAGFDPEAVAYMQELERRNQELAAQAAKAPAAPAPAAFVPVTLPMEVQLVVDTVPELLAMQVNPDQTAFKVAQKQEAALRVLPEWEGKTDAERYAEAARLANAMVKGSTTAAPPPPNSGAQPTQAERDAALAAAQRAAAGNPVAIGDLRGGASPTSQIPDYTKMKSDADIMADLDRFA